MLRIEDTDQARFVPGAEQYIVDALAWCGISPDEGIGVGGFDGVYEFAKDFRNEGMDRTHNPEFTVMEIYVAYKDYRWMMDFTEKALAQIALEINGSTILTVSER